MNVPRPTWVMTKLDELGEIYCGQSVSESEVNRAGRGVVYVTGPEQWNGRHIEENKWTENPRRVVPQGCIFITVKGAGVGKTFPGIAAAIGRDVYAYKPTIEIDADFVHRAIRHRIASLVSEARGDIPGLSREHLADYVVPLPPVAEQRRIVAKLDGLTARIAGTRKQIQYARAMSVRMRERVITSAFNGQLTKNWRMGGRDGRQETLDHGSHRFSKSAKRKIADISWRPDLQLPLGWRWASVDSVTTLCDYGTSERSTHGEEGIPVLRMGNIQRGEIEFSNMKFLPKDAPGRSDLFLCCGDVLFNRTNSFELVGKSAMFRGYHRKVTFASYLIRLRTSHIKAELLTFYLNSSFCRSWVDIVASQQVGQANVNGTKLKSLGIPLPPIEEQAEIVRLIEATHARADRLEAEADRAVMLLDRLETSILTKAFRGELVPQDPTDEPASALLDRIRADRAPTPKAKRGRSAAPSAND